MSYQTISDKIANGDYKTKLEYPERLKKPTMPTFNVTPAIARDFADKLEAYESSKDEVTRARNAYHSDISRLEQEVFRADLEAAYDTTGHPKADKLWAKAWEHGHSEGLGNVLYWYDEFYDLV